MSSLTRWLVLRFPFLSLVNPTLLVAALAIALLFFFSHLSLRYIHASQERIIREHLLASLGSFSELINIWQQQNIAAIQMLARSTQGQQLLRQVLMEEGDEPVTQEALRDWLYPILIVMGFDGFSVINHKRIIVAASSPGYIKQPAQLPETLEVLNKALANQPAISRPVAAVRPIEGPRGQQPAGTLMQNMCVTLDAGQATAGKPESNELPPGFFCLRFNTHTSFFPIFLKGWTGRSGDIYAIDHNGNFITPARFGQQNPQLLTVEQQRAARLGTPVRVPKDDNGNTSLTEMADFLINREASLVRVDYRDYRGVAVAGAGRWIPEMELGVIVEQDLDEAMAPYYAARNIILSLTTAAATLIMLLSFGALANRRRLAIREGRFRSLLDNLPPPVHMLSRDQHVIVANPSFCQLLGLEKTAILGRDLRELPVPGWLQSLFDEELNCSPEFCHRDEIVRLQLPTGEARYFRIVRFPVVHPRAQEPEAIASVWVDYTDRVLANEQLEAVNQNLEDLVNDRTRELIIAKDQALAASHSKAEFLANMSHEIRTPLNAIIGLAHVALTSKPDPRQKVYLEKIRGSGEHLLQIINDILNFSRMEAGKLELDNSEFFIDQLIDKSLDLIWEKAAAKGLEVKVDIDPRIPKVLVGDSLRLGQILINFCANAVKFTDTGSISIAVNQVRDWETKVELLFEVKDTGIGIAPEKIEQLFQPFQQVDASSARRFEGTGLGLSICKNLAELMGGRIDVKSILGHGSNFRLRVQLEKTRTPANETPVASPAAPIQSLSNVSRHFSPVECTVLVVEDNPLNQEIIMSLLESMGTDAFCVDSGPAAILAVQHEAIDLVLMDIQLPGMDGVEATTHIRQLDKGKRLPIVAVTANALPGDRESYLAAGMDDYLSKPIDPALLHRVLEQWGKARSMPEPVKPFTNRFEFLQHGGIDTARALHHLMNNESLYQRLLERFARERAEFPQQLHHLLETDLPSALNQVHSLKSLAGSLGMLQLESIALQLEEQLRNGSFDPTQVEKLTAELRAMVKLVSLGLDLRVKQ